VLGEIRQLQAGELPIEDVIKSLHQFLLGLL